METYVLKNSELVRFLSELFSCASDLDEEIICLMEMLSFWSDFSFCIFVSLYDCIQLYRICQQGIERNNCWRDFSGRIFQGGRIRQGFALLAAWAGEL